MDVTVFEQDGKAYAAISHRLSAPELAKNIAKEIRYMPRVPRAKMRVVSVEQFKAMPFGKPKYS
jgi:hypothetical protein